MRLSDENFGKKCIYLQILAETLLWAAHCVCRPSPQWAYYVLLSLEKYFHTQHIAAQDKDIKGHFATFCSKHLKGCSRKHVCKWVTVFHKMQKTTLFGTDIHKGRRKDKEKKRKTKRQTESLIFWCFDKSLISQFFNKNKQLYATRNPPTVWSRVYTNKAKDLFSV